MDERDSLANMGRDGRAYLEDVKQGVVSEWQEFEMEAEAYDVPLTPTAEAIAKGEAWVQGPGNGEAKAVFAAQVADMVNSPAHYARGAVEPIDYMRQVLGEEGFIAFCHGSALKYLSRALYKGAREQDYAKAAWYCRMAAGDDPRKELT